MTMFADPDPRTDPDPRADERATLVAFLKWQRQTLELKCSGLDAEQLARRSLEPSIISLLGLVRHLADVELGWFRQVMSRQPGTPYRFCTAEDDDRAFNGAVADEHVVAEAWDAWHDEIAFSNRFIAEAKDLDVTGWEKWRGEMSLRWVLTHMIEEYARHNDHADLLRERIDGAVGQ